MRFQGITLTGQFDWLGLFISLLKFVPDLTYFSSSLVSFMTYSLLLIGFSAILARFFKAGGMARKLSADKDINLGGLS